MSLLDLIFAEPELRDAPPVLVDVGAAGGVHAAWRRISRYSIGIGFEPDPREAAPLLVAPGQFKRWILCPGLVSADAPASTGAVLHLTRSPQCSSTLHPCATAVNEWAFASFFDVMESRECTAVRLDEALRAQGLERIDWLKCDTQGTDLRLYLSLPLIWRTNMLAVEFEPGLIDAYQGEDRAADVLAAMSREPYWLAEMKIGQTPRGRPALIRRHLGAGCVKWFRRTGPTAPAWVNLRYLRDPAIAADALNRRALLLGWVFATMSGQHGQALTMAVLGEERFGKHPFAIMAAQSTRALRCSVVLGVPAMIIRRLLRR